MNIRRYLQFSKPKGPGFGISRGYYLSVLSSRPVWPALTELIHPKGHQSAVVGFGAPLRSDLGKDSLERPMERGAFALADRERKTVLKMILLSRDEAGFDPEAFVRSPLAVGLSDDALGRLRATWSLAQLTFETHEPMVYPALDFFLGIAERLAELSDGLVADPISQRYLLPSDLQVAERRDPRIDSRDHVRIQDRGLAEGVHVYTLGMQKFALPEYEIFGLPPDAVPAAYDFLQSLAQSVLLGDLTRSGDRYGAKGSEFEAREGGLDRGLWEGISVFELLPPVHVPPGDAVNRWVAAAKLR